MISSITRQKAKLLLLVFLCIPFSAYAVESNPVSQQSPVTTEVKQEHLMGKLSGFTQTFKSGGGYLDFGLRTGYISGQNSYELGHHVSELEFPFRSYLGGGNLNLGYKDLSINFQAWGTLFDDPSGGYHMKDKDWTAGELWSDTKTNSNMNGVIWDANMRYNFLRYSFGQKKINQKDRNIDNIKLGVLLGYRYERFGYKGFGLYQTCLGTGHDWAYGEETMITEYKVKYRLPYYGLAMNFENDKFGVAMDAKYAFKPHAMDYDHHALRSPPLHFYGDYKGNANVFMADCAGAWKFRKGWEASVGADAALIRINGVTWEQDGLDPDANQQIDTHQFIYWMGLAYRF